MLQRASLIGFPIQTSATGWSYSEARHFLYFCVEHTFHRSCQPCWLSPWLCVLDHHTRWRSPGACELGNWWDVAPALWVRRFIISIRILLSYADLITLRPSQFVCSAEFWLTRIRWTYLINGDGTVVCLNCGWPILPLNSRHQRHRRTADLMVVAIHMILSPSLALLQQVCSFFLEPFYHPPVSLTTRFRWLC
jgi:hypothetical protein